MSVGLFIDGAYVRKAFEENMDYKKLRDHVEDWTDDTVDEGYFFDVNAAGGRNEKLHYALSLPAPRGPGLRVKNDYWSQTRPLYWPAKLGGGPVEHPVFPNIAYEQTTQKGVDVGLIFHMLRSHQNRKWTKLVLAAGDGDFHEPVQHLVEVENVELYLVGSLRSISGRLRPYARATLEIDQEPLHSALRFFGCIVRSSSPGAIRAVPSLVG